MITGFNTDVKHGAKVYHVQTEDKGRKNPKVETLVYVGGEILDNHRTSYEKSRTELSEDQIMALMEGQHKRVIRSIKIGKYDEPGTFPEGVITSRTLDEVILEHWGNQPIEERLMLVVKGAEGFKANTQTTLNIETHRQESKDPAPNTQVRVKLVHATQPVQVLADGNTDAEGVFSTLIDLPNWGSGDCNLIVQAISEWGVAEQRIRLHR